VHEALGTLVSPALCEQLIARSLALHGIEEIPEGGSDVAAWLEGSLRPTVELAVGPDAAELMMAQLGPIAAYAAISKPLAKPLMPAATPQSMPVRSYRPPRPSAARQAHEDREIDVEDRPTAMPVDARVTLEISAEDRNTDPRFNQIATPVHSLELSLSAQSPANANFSSTAPSLPVRTKPPPQPLTDRPPSHPAAHTTRPMPHETVVSETINGLPQVLTATNDQSDLLALRRYLDGTARVTHISDLVALLDVLQEPDLIEPILLIDCHRPSVHVTSVTTLGEDLPEGTTVVLWGADDATWEQVDRLRTPRCRWVRCSREATTDDVGSLCSMLLG
jgi:hypothetical protein